jgi:hypothetical protein
MMPVNADAVKSNSLWIAWTGSAFAAVSVFLMLGVWINDSRVGHSRFLLRSGSDTGDGGVGKRGVLSAIQARYVCKQWSETFKRGDNEIKEWACSICLDDNEEECDIRTVKMPCTHRFHRL